MTQETATNLQRKEQSKKYFHNFPMGLRLSSAKIHPQKSSQQH
jgi:hypothetical protein